MKKTILIIDDEVLNRRVLRKILESDGFRVMEAENGRVAFDILKKKEPPIALALLDLSMPVMDGYELLEKLKQTGLLVQVPVIVTTGNNQDDEEVKSLRYGASDFITKPYKVDVVRHRVRSLLRLCENAALLSQLETDPLTGVYSREFFYRRVESLLQEDPEGAYDIVCSDIEDFKLVNANYGIEVGDDLLRCIARHNMDCVGDDGVCGRLGADTFAVFRKRKALRTQEEIGRLYTETFADAPVKNFVMKYGVFAIEDRSVSVSVMCDRAQVALNSIKGRYGVHYALYDDSMREKMFREHQLSDCMEEALEQEQFLVYLQPKHDVGTEAVIGAEALVRWQHPELGFISPGEFIELFEKNGFISKLDWYILEETCRLQQRWISEGRRTVPLSVNASRADFNDDDYPEAVEALVDSYGLPHELIHIEVTESAYTDNPHQIISAVSRLRDKGFLIEMDDFGSGYSSLNTLSELPVDILKLDMRFIQSSDGFYLNGRRGIIGFIISLSKWLQLSTVAEGVETEDELEQLKTLGCDCIQGFFFSKPMPVAEFEEYIDRYERASDVAAKTNAASTRFHPAIPSPSQKRPHVLIVEDVSSNRELLTALLSPYYTTAAVCDGQEAYRYISEHHTEIACVLLDLMMPIMDGFQLLDLMRDEGLLDEIPVVITTEDGNKAELRAIRLGASGFVSKPYDPEILLHHVEQAVNESRLKKIIKEQNR